MRLDSNHAVCLPLRSARQHNRNSDQGFNEGNLVLCCLDLFLAGSETSSKTLQWGLIYLINNPHIQGGCSDKTCSTWIIITVIDISLM